MIDAWRISKSRYATAALDGEGARLNGGRWNTVGTRVAYASDSVALATLEVLVGLQVSTILASYSLIRVEFAEDVVEVLDKRTLPARWNHQPPSPESQGIGGLWAAEARSVVLKVPSAIAKAGFNYLFNPLHPRFGEVLVREPEPFQLGPRLLK